MEVSLCEHSLSPTGRLDLQPLSLFDVGAATECDATAAELGHSRSARSHQEVNGVCGHEKRCWLIGRTF